jgi:hypothetical protein
MSGFTDSTPKMAEYQQKNILKLELLSRREQVSLVGIGPSPVSISIPQDGGV